MLTLQQQPTPLYGYRAVHDQPTPPLSTKSPVLNYSSSTPSLSWRDASGPPTMSAPHRGLPPPAAMSMQPQQPPASHPPPHVSAHPSTHPSAHPSAHPSVHPPAHSPSHQPPPPVHHSQQPSMPPQAPPHHHHRDSWGGPSGSAAPLPPPPQHWSNSDESMRNWLQARTEEEKTRQEEERTRQESLRLEQRKIEMDMLRSSIGGGIPPPMIPLVFAGMASGGVLPQAALDWAHQFMTSQSQYPQLPPPPPRPHSPESQREAAAQASTQYHPANAPPPAHGGGYAAYGTSPTRTRGQTVSGVIARPGTGSNMSSAGSNTPQSGGPPPSTSTLGPFQPHQSSGGQSNQHDSTLFFHHWQPPVSQSGQSAGGSNRPSSPAGESQKKRKAGGDPPHHNRTSSTQRPRSPPSFIQSDFGSVAGRKSHKRHKSDVSWYQGPRHSMGPGSIPESGHRARTPAQDNSSTSSKDRDVAEGSRRDSQPETYSRLRHEDDGQASRDREREREPASGERAA
ncbi:hypothetical protein PWT90_10731 [Aphanocladium album]|nr:hypothetical protein PWT90_10731 [Aphanocladium album]